MLNGTFAKRLWITTAIFSTLVLLSYSNAFASEGRSNRGRYNRIENNREYDARYRYHDNRWYRRGWFGIEIAVPSPIIGAVVANIPVGHATITVAGMPYYYYNHVYFRPCQTGYIVVPTPQENPVVVAAPPAPQPQVLAQLPTQNTLTINVPNSSGSYTTVTLAKTSNGYIGPQGEFYPGNPTVDQLKVLYGK